MKKRNDFPFNNTYDSQFNIELNAFTCFHLNVNTPSEYLYLTVGIQHRESH